MGESVSFVARAIGKGKCGEEILGGGVSQGSYSLTFAPDQTSK